MNQQFWTRMGVAAIASLGLTTLAASALFAGLARDKSTAKAAQVLAQASPPNSRSAPRTERSKAAAEAAAETAETAEQAELSGEAAAEGMTEAEEAEPLPALVAIAPAQVPPNLGLDPQIWGKAGRGGDRDTLLTAIDHSLRYLNTAKAAEDYADYAIESISRDRVRRSLERFRQLVLESASAQALQAAVHKEFEFYQSTGQTGQNDAHFTGYFEPTYRASAVRTAEYRYPLFATPADLDTWPEPHPDRSALEGKDGLQADKGPLKGLELVWLGSRLEAFLVQVQGSAKLALTDGSTMSIGYAGRTNYPYVSVGRELVNDGKFTLEELSLPLMLDFFRKNPQALDDYLPRNPRFVFFKATGGAPPTGSLSVPVVAERSIATDKSLLPPGALALIATQLPYPLAGGNGRMGYVKRPVNRFVLDQDTGGAIQGAGRADVFMGTGVEAGDRAGLMNESGQLYYLMLKDGL